MNENQPNIILNDDKSILHLNIKPDQIALDKLIVVGDPGLVHPVSVFFDKVVFEMHKREFITHTGTLNGEHISVMSTGIGSDNIEIFYNELDALANYDFKKKKIKEKPKKLKIVRVGTSMSLQQDIEPGTITMAQHGVGFDNVFNFYQLPQSEREREIGKQIKESLQLDFLPYCIQGASNVAPELSKGTIEGNVLTVPGFYAPQGRSVRLPLRFPEMVENLSYMHYQDFWLTDIDMETAAHYAMARLLGHEVVSINLIVGQLFSDKILKSKNKNLEKLIQHVLEHL